jgi:hypothetical protein
MPEPTVLYPTPSRRLLLADVRDLKVADDEDGDTWLNQGDGTRRRLTAVIREFEQAGWVHRIPDGLGWRLTPLGVDVLEGRGAS